MSAAAGLRRFAGVLVSLIAVAAVVWWASKQDAPTVPGEPGELALIGLAVVLYAIATLARGWRWHTILRLDGIAHRRGDALGLVCVGYMGNNVLPARGGEVLRIVLLGRRTDARRREILGSIIAERALDAVVLVALFVLLTMVGVAGSPVGWLPAAAAVGALLAGAAVLAVYLRLRTRGRFERFAEIVRPFVKASKPLLRPAGAALVAVTVLVWLLEAVIFVLVARSLDVTIDVVEGLFLDVLASFFALVPAAPGYVGTFDAAVLFGLDALDVTGGTALSVALLVRFVLFVPITAAGLVLLLARYGGLASLRRRELAEAQA